MQLQFGEKYIWNWSEKKTFVLFFILGVLRLVFAWKIPLIDDEAYHWTWTQDLMLSYYDHPGLVAWMGSLSTKLFGTSYFSVRLPALIFFFGVVYFIYRLARDLFGPDVAFWVGLMVYLSPFWGFGGYVASPEPPFMFFFTLSTWIFFQGYRKDKTPWSLKKTWLLLGLTMGLGLNSKFIIALLALGFGFYLLFSKDDRKSLISPWPWVGFLIATLLATPIFLWNVQFDWPGFVYQFHERHTGTEFSLQRWSQWFAAQWLFYTIPVYFLMLVAVIQSWKKIADPPWRFIAFVTLPTLLVFYLQPLWADYKPHWPGAAHLLLLIGGMQVWKKGFRYLKPYSYKFTLTLTGFLATMNFLLYTPFMGPWMPKVYGWIKDPATWNTQWDLSNEFHGWEELGSELHRQSRAFHGDTGTRPFFAALRYETTAQTWWGSKQKTYTLNTTRSHFTVMQEFRKDLEGLKGLNALVVTTEKYPADPLRYAVFERCDRTDFPTTRSGQASRVFTIWKCYRFQGLKTDQ